MDINLYTPAYHINRKHIIKLTDYSTEEIFELLFAIRSLKAKFIAHESTENVLKDTTIALIFGDTSIRTRSAIEIGIHQLGGYAINLPYSQEDMEAGENIKDIADVLSRYGVGAIITRGIPEKDLMSYCAISKIPIINSSNADEIPLQTLCDLFTIWEKVGHLEDVKLAYVGKGDNNAASLISGAIKCGMQVSVATPPKYPIKQEKIRLATQYGPIHITTDPHEAVEGADIVYTDCYSYHTPLTDEDRKYLAPYQINEELMREAARGAYFMHALPANRGTEVTEAVIDGPRSIVLDQAYNKLHVVKAILVMLVK
ncbi:MAG: ornithine carbamoyltransferase [Clostridia bacterium]|nr:ornithine carbamoyltransferase [Clostridia bacterium]